MLIGLALANHRCPALIPQLARSLLLVRRLQSRVEVSGAGAMQIANIFSRQSDPTKLGRRNEAVEPAGKQSSGSSSVQAASAAGTADAMRQILSQYDVTNITPRAFSEMLQKMNQAGALPDKDYQELSLVRVDLDHEGIGPDERVNLVDLYTQKLRKFREDLNDFQKEATSLESRQAMEAPIRRRLDWLQKFATIQASPNAVGVNAVV
jgi:hypothetical protein